MLPTQNVPTTFSEKKIMARITISMPKRDIIIYKQHPNMHKKSIFHTGELSKIESNLFQFGKRIKLFFHVTRFLFIW